ncbi:STAS domain-containing protein [Hoyosella sp. YIM 151337]|uniref:STAS domain-containing protein n=1 Tax=Hoyosella sp. YIM 151337 TaxID=2992742 RepID=UPI0022364AE6|nr:STAS domain-containing protein [Hoyosella sp. YIM 151337]MCW4355501.1 STAS domain-containing protein [Hoyosella sp. YIM 151337]
MVSPARRWGSAWSLTIYPTDGVQPAKTARGTSLYVIELRGDLDAASRQELGVQLRRLLDFGVAMTLDLSSLDFCGVAAIEEIASIAADARAREIELVIVAPENISQYLELRRPTGD